MTSVTANQRIIATHGVGSGNAPALTICSVGHLRVASFLILKTYSYDHKRKTGFTPEGKRVQF